VEKRRESGQSYRAIAQALSLPVSSVHSLIKNYVCPV
jgi:DNA-directed RNA polymerase specialized sigma24 family protein